MKTARFRPVQILLLVRRLGVIIVNDFPLVISLNSNILPSLSFWGAHTSSQWRLIKTDEYYVHLFPSFVGGYKYTRAPV